MYSEWYRSFCGPQLHSYVFSLEEAGILSSGLCNLNDSVNVTPPVLRESKNPLCSVTCLWDLPASFVFHCIAMFVFQVCLCSCFQVLSVNISKQSIIQTHLWWALTQVFSGAPGAEILNRKQSGMKKIHFSLTSSFFLKESGLFQFAEKTPNMLKLLVMMWALLSLPRLHLHPFQMQIHQMFLI